MSNLVIPNSFQTPNAYVDIAMQYLTGDEFKVLMFAVRHIFGFQDRIEGRQHQMSLSMFQHGTPWSAGTNLSKNTLRKVLKQLIAFNLLERIPIRDETDGGLYRICASPDWDAMKKRHEELDAKNRQRAVKMNAPAEGITSDVIPVEGITSDGNPAITSDGNPGITSDVIQTNPPSNPILKPKKSTASAARTKTSKPKAEKPDTDKSERVAKKDALFDEIVRVFKYDPKRLTKSERSSTAKVAWELLDAGYRPEHVRIIYGYLSRTRSKYNTMHMIYDASAAIADFKERYGYDPITTVLEVDAAAEGTPPQPDEDAPVDESTLIDATAAFEELGRAISGNRIAAAGKR